MIGLVALIATVAENANPLRIGRQARRSTVQDLLGPRGASVRYRSTISARRGGRFYCSADHACDVRSSRGAWPEGSQNLGGLTGRRRRRPQPLQLIRRILEARGDACLEKSMQRSTLVLLAVRWIIVSTCMCIEDNTYGYCEETGEPISLMRLEARPIATLSVGRKSARKSAKNSTATSSTPSVPGQAVQLAKAADKAAGLQAIVILGRANGVVFAENSGLADAASQGRGA